MFAAFGSRRPLKWSVVILGLGLIVITLFFLHRPAWWVEAGDSSSAAVSRGRGLEQALSREFTKVREPGDWGFVLGDEDLNAWLANRLEPWAESRGDITIPPEFSDPRLRFGDDWVELGLLSRPVGFGIMSTIRFQVRLEGGDLVFQPTFARLGPLDMTGQGLSYLEEYSQSDDRLEFDSSGEIRVPAVVTLVDGRRVLIEDLEIVEGEMAVRLRTLGP